MRVFSETLDRDEYIACQIERSESKINYCRVSILDALSILNILKAQGYSSGPIICMGTRNGREMDLFRYARSHSLSALTYLLERKKCGFSSWLPILESFGRSNIEHIDTDGVYGVELNPSIKRNDTYIGSFDALPSDFENRFSIIYSNAFDHVLSAEDTAQEWRRIAKSGQAYVVLDFVENDVPTHTDPLGGLCKQELAQLFQAKIVYYGERAAFDPIGNINRLILKM